MKKNPHIFAISTLMKQRTVIVNRINLKSRYPVSEKGSSVAFFAVSRPPTPSILWSLVFSHKSNSRIANVSLSIWNQNPSASKNHAHQPNLSISAIKPINNRAYQPLNLLTIEPIDHWAYQSLILSIWIEIKKIDTGDHS